MVVFEYHFDESKKEHSVTWMGNKYQLNAYFGEPRLNDDEINELELIWRVTNVK